MLAMAAWFISPLACAQEGVFLWKSEKLYEDQVQRKLLQRAKTHDFERIYWGVTAEQASHPALMMAKLGPLMQQLRDQGTQSWLLLGDVNWILPEHRPSLLKLIGRFEGYPFDGIMLDIEVEQFGFPVPEHHLQGWVDTLRASVQVSNKPIEVTAHWRWFESGHKPCWVCQIQASGIQGATMMIYSTNIDRVSAIVENAERPTGFKLRVAQSLEPFLSKEESWAQYPRAQRQQGINRLRQAVHYPLDWQAYEFIDPLE
jgi:hypothetical protein